MAARRGRRHDKEEMDMSMMKCVEEVYDALKGAGLRDDHNCFEDLLYGCVAMATGSEYTDIVAYIAAMDSDRDETSIGLDICSFIRHCGSKDRPSAIVARAVAAGKVGWEQ